MTTIDTAETLDLIAGLNEDEMRLTLRILIFVGQARPTDPNRLAPLVDAAGQYARGELERGRFDDLASEWVSANLRR